MLPHADLPARGSFLSDAVFREKLSKWEGDRLIRFRVLGEQLADAGEITTVQLSDWSRCERHPLFHGLMELVERFAGTSVTVDAGKQIVEAIARLQQVPSTWHSAPLGAVADVEQEPLLMPSDPYARTRIRLVSAERRDELVEHTHRLTQLFAEAQPSTCEFVCSALRVVTFVESERDGDYFSGSFSDYFGACHMAPTFYMDAFGEMLVHEAEHARLHLLERDHPFMEERCDRESRFYSPWRPDPRPLFGIFHGAHVFGSVSTFLVGLITTSHVEPGRTALVRRRLALVTTQLDRAIRELEAHSALTLPGAAVLDQARARYEAVKQLLDTAELGAAQATVEHEERRRKAAWTS